MPSDAHRIASAYSEWSATYDAMENRTRDLSARILRAENLAIHGADVVEFGCGTGLNTLYLAAHARRVTALDFSDGMLSVARRRVSAAHVVFAACDITRPWPTVPQTADIVIGNLVLEHVAELGPVFAHAHRALAAGGQMFVCELHPARQMMGKKAVFTDAAGQDVDIPAYLHDVSEYVNAAQACGLQLRAMGEWRDNGASKIDPPRLVTLRLEKP